MYGSNGVEAAGSLLFDPSVHFVRLERGCDSGDFDVVASQLMRLATKMKGAKSLQMIDKFERTVAAFLNHPGASPSHPAI